ncbi:MAG: OmpA family protein, partial [Spirochaetales bacterium]
EPAAQRPLPADLPHNLVYGCYLDGKEVRLILNLAAIAEHATDERLQNVLASMSTVHRRGLAPGRASTTPQATREQAAAEAPAAKSDTSLDTEPEDLSEEFVRGESVSSTESQSEENGVVSVAPADAGRKDGEASDEVLVPDTDSSEDFPAEPDIELDLEGDGAKDSEIPDEGAPDEEASPIALEIEPELTVDPQIVEWEESGMKAEATTDFNEHAATAPELPRVSEQTPRPEELSRDERRDDRAKRGSRKRRLVIPMVFVLIAATVGVILFFEHSVFDRLLAQAGDVFSGDVASESPEATDRSEAARDVPIAERAVPPNPPAEPSPAGSASREPATATAVEFSERVYFAADSAELLPSARQTLDQIVRRVNEGERWTIEIVGHVAQADHGTPESYRWLSEQRALTVRDYLVPRFSVEPAELSITGRGASDPAASNDSPDGRALNRRVVVVVESSVP